MNRKKEKQKFSSYYMKIKLQKYATVLFRTCMIITMCYLFLYPVFYMGVTSIMTLESASDPTVLYIPKGMTFDNIKTAFSLLEFPKSATLSLVITVFSTLGTLFSCSLTGYAFARFRFKGKNLIFVFVLLMIIVPQQTLIMPNYLQYHFFDMGGLLSIFGVKLNLLDTPWVFILPSFFASGLKAGIFIFIFRQFFTGLPKELEAAARIDGCGPLKTFVLIMVPLAVPAFITVVMFSVIWHWNEYYSSSLYFLGDTKPIMVMLENLLSKLRLNGVLSEANTEFQSRIFLQAGALICILPPFVLYLFTQKYFIESIERSGITG